jgi:hypothetical protein
MPELLLVEDNELNRDIRSRRSIRNGCRASGSECVGCHAGAQERQKNARHTGYRADGR